MAVWSVVKVSALSPDMRLDAEYYKPNLLDLVRQLAGMKARPWGELDGRFVVGPFGSDFNVENFVEESSYRYIRGKDVKPFFVQDNDNVYMPEHFYAELKKYALFAGDLLVSVVGTLGNCAVVTEDVGDAVFSCKSTAWRPDNGIDDFPLYLTTYLNSRIGQSFLQRLPRGHIQTGLNLDDLKSIPIVEPAHSQVKQIALMVRGAHDARRDAKDALAAAEKLLLAALGLDHIDLSPSRSYSRTFKDLLAGRRFGAEYYMPCKQRALDALAKLPNKTLLYHAPNIREMWDPASAGHGVMVRNFDLGDALEPFLDDTKNPVTASEVGSTKKKFQAGDVVVSRLRSYLKEIAVVRTGNAMPSVGSSEFIVLRPTGRGLSAEAILVFLRCPLVQTILKWSQDGSNHPRFDEDDMIALPVPDRLMEVSAKIERHVHDAISARQEAARLLEQAKQTVEDMIGGTA